MKKKILISTGGTGGHVYPAIALAQQLVREMPDCEILFVGGALDKNKYFDRNQFNYRTVPCATFVSKSPKALISAFFNILKGMWHSRSIIRKFGPDVVVGFGSFYAFPPLVTAKLMGIPLVLHEQNSIPGKVNSLLAPWAEVTGVHFPETVRLLKGKVIEVGLPLRNGFHRVEGSRDAAKSYFGLVTDEPIILIFGGSQGARALNALVSDVMTQLHAKISFQVIHLTGNEQITQTLQEHYHELGIKVCVKTFETNMQLAWQAADLIIGRAGAGTVAEQLEFEVPGILIPYPFAMDNHQDHNADFMVTTVGGAVKLHEKGLTADRLVRCLVELMKDNGNMLKGMQEAMRHYKKKARGRNLYSLVKEQL